MARLRFLGTSAGIAPVKDLYNTALTLETDNRTYWFDAGECCARNAYISGVRMMSVSNIFISHPHEDHIGGLYNLLFLIYSQMWREKTKPVDDDINLFLPVSGIWEPTQALITNIFSRNILAVINPNIFKRSDIYKELTTAL